MSPPKRPRPQRRLLSFTDDRPAPKPDPAPPRLSVCLIVRNEARVLRRALRSVQELADEIIVVDTGSTDHTVELARSLGARTFFLAWNDHFAEARNYSLDQATGDWLLILDADEEFCRADTEKVRALLRTTESDAIAVLLKNFLPCEATRTDESLADPELYRYTTNHLIRLVRNRPELRFHGRIHEDFPRHVLPLERVYFSDVSLYHYGYAVADERQERRAQRNLRLLEQYVQEQPEDPAAYYHLGTCHLAAGRDEAAVQAFQEVLARTQPPASRGAHFRVMALFHLACHAARHADYPAEEKYCVEALQLAPEDLDAWLRVGEAFFHQEKYWMAERAFHRYRRLLHQYRRKPTPTRYTLFQLGLEHLACYYLGRLAEFRFDWARAQEFYRQAIELDPARAAVAHFYLANLLAREQDLEGMKAHLARAQQLQPQLIQRLLGQPIRLPAADRSELGGTAPRAPEAPPDPTATYPVR